MNNETKHIPVLLSEVIEALAPQKGKRFIDATLGGAGHTRQLLERQSQVLGLDQDQSALQYVAHVVNNPNLITVEANFMTIKNQAQKYGFTAVDGILFDLGVSSFQLDTPERGFSFLYEAPLDMRMSRSNQITAAEIVNNETEDELFELLMSNAQEPKSRAIAEAIVSHRPFHTTTELANLIESVYGGRRGKIHPATRTFQALRIAVNQELKIIKPALKDAFGLLKIGGRLCVIGFHEGEDRIVKRTFSELIDAGQAHLCGKNPIVPNTSEINNNPRSRSAKLRIVERVA